ncbi:uncharacterized protein HMPREF1120_02129 [Exophiala dermatitidis NIH/UT8656]|uniref:Uncharacterized protein n=1 Tax=Exophiala dermatitidis (strain ATCC 34100 / CBS 525.76 / NIH/UT8656) TaxID=858893 RepID=H6BR90_EXODN|nr:uncharacterized protein HMPREF1120_02129 [Exophiala dermatitidis NIH/UT8656]EHY53950.1 hypothetical protein HMPREF1120_02129 [Exophiala dermatitidis NIH/UT8656]KAJ4575626.1 hypothetical protein HRR79_002534 [Exophiala dermatitidis]
MNFLHPNRLRPRSKQYALRQVTVNSAKSTVYRYDFMASAGKLRMDNVSMIEKNGYGVLFRRNGQGCKSFKSRVSVVSTTFCKSVTGTGWDQREDKFNTMGGQWKQSSS